MRILAIVHDADAGPGVFGELARERGHELHDWGIAAGSRAPEAPAGYDAVLSLGGSMDAHEYDRHPWLAEEQALLGELARAGRPVLGVCLGAQILARAAGGDSGPMAEPEIGWCEVQVSETGTGDPLLGPLAPGFSALQWHSCAFTTPPGTPPLAGSRRCPQAYRAGERAWGIQFHAEVTLADFERWIDDHLAHENGHGPADPEALRAQTRARIGAWNAFGRALFGRFLDAAADGAAARA